MALDPLAWQLWNAVWNSSWVTSADINTNFSALSIKKEN